jgi:hypothetical protein
MIMSLRKRITDLTTSLKFLALRYDSMYLSVVISYS